jgi:hypothetical protein
MDDRRSFLRQRVLREGKLVFNSGSSAISCIIRELGPGGAKLRLPAPTCLPRKVGLMCLTSKLLYPAEIVWCHEDELYVAFTGEPRRVLLSKMAKPAVDTDGVIRPAAVEPTSPAIRKH